MSGQDVRSLNEIYEIYHEKGRLDEGIDLLSKEINSGRLNYTDANLENVILKMMKHYFEDPGKEPGRFYKLIYRKMGSKHILKLIENYFSDSRLEREVRRAIRRWQTPVKIDVTPVIAMMKVDSSKVVTATFYNDKGNRLDDVKLDYEISPKGSGEFYKRTNTFKALKEGETLLKLMAVGNEKISKVVEITILESPEQKAPEAKGPTIFEFDQKKGIKGTTIRITGKDFDRDLSKNSVIFKGSKSIPRDGTNTCLIVDVPAGTRDGTQFQRSRCVYQILVSNGFRVVEGIERNVLGRMVLSQIYDLSRFTEPSRLDPA